MLDETYHAAARSGKYLMAVNRFTAQAVHPAHGPAQRGTPAHRGTASVDELGLSPPIYAQPLNRGRTIVARAFSRTLHSLRGEENVTERTFRDRWQRLVAESGEMTADGWYNPPSMGMAVLFATAADPSRVNFRTFRDRESFVSGKVMDHTNGIVLGYASNVHLKTGLPGDFATTVYLGKDPRVLDHFKRARELCRAIIAKVHGTMTAGELHVEALAELQTRELGGTTHSDTDPDGHNVGHSLPRLRVGPLTDTLRTDEIETLRNGRLFIRRDGTWPVGSVDQFTIEPQVVSANDPTLPKVMLHYVISAAGSVVVCDACEEPLRDLAII